MGGKQVHVYNIFMKNTIIYTHTHQCAKLNTDGGGKGNRCLWPMLVKVEVNWVLRFMGRFFFVILYVLSLGFDPNFFSTSLQGLDMISQLEVPDNYCRL